MSYYMNKFPINNVISTEGKPMESIPVGTPFRVFGISCNMIELIPVAYQNLGCQPITVDCSMLQFGFTESQFLHFAG